MWRYNHIIIILYYKISPNQYSSFPEFPRIQNRTLHLHEVIKSFFIYRFISSLSYFFPCIYLLGEKLVTSSYRVPSLWILLIAFLWCCLSGYIPGIFCKLVINFDRDLIRLLWGEKGGPGWYVLPSGGKLILPSYLSFVCVCVCLSLSFFFFIIA